MGFDFFKATRAVLQNMNKIKPTKTSEYTSALQSIQDYLKPLNDKWGIFDRFSTFASDVSTLLANVGFAIDDYNKYSQSLINMVQLT